MFFQKYGINIRDGEYLLEKFNFFKKDIIDEVLKTKKIENIELQLLMAEAFRIARFGNKSKYQAWYSKKITEVQNLILTEQEKEERAMKTWKMFVDNKNSFIQTKK